MAHNINEQAMINIWKSSLILFVACVIRMVPAVAGEVMKVNTYGAEPFTTKQATGLFDVVVKDAFLRAGISASISWVPAKRGLRRVSHGQDGAHYPRTIAAIGASPNLIVVPTPFFQTSYVAVVRQAGVDVKNWEDLRKYRVGYLLGWQIFANKKEFFGKVQPSRIPESMFKMLKADRVDVVLYEKMAFMQLAAKMDLSGLTVLEPPIATSFLHLILHKKHAELIPRLSQAFVEQRESGDLAKLCPPCANSFK